MTAIIQHVPPDALRSIIDLQLQTLIQRDETIAKLNGTLGAIRAAANGDLTPDQDTETLVRQMYHEREDLRQENAKLRRSLMKDTASPFSRGATE